MSQTSMALVCLLAVTILPGCTSSSGGGGIDNKGKVPQSPTEAIAKLSPTHQQNFENWKKRVVKSCNGPDALGLVASNGIHAVGIDGAALIQLNGGSVIYSENGSFAVVTGFNSFSGIETSKFHITNINGQGDSISVETKREGSNCAVYLYGQKVHEAKIAESLVIGAHWSPGKTAKIALPAPQVRPLGTSGLSEAVQHAAYDVIAQTLRPTIEASNLIARKLNLTEEQTSKLLRLSGATGTGSAVRIANEPTAIWSNHDSGNLIAHGNVLSNLFNGTTLPLEVRLGIPAFEIGTTKNTADTGSLRLAFNISVASQDGLYMYSTQSLTNQGLIPFAKDEATACAKDRAMTYMGIGANQNQITPSVSLMFGPCRTLDPEIEKDSYANGLFRSLLPHMFAGMSPSPNFQYGGWDQVLSKLALEAMDQNKSIRLELDPSEKTNIIGVVAEHLEALRQELTRTKSLTPSKNAVYQMGLQWSLKGHHVLSGRIAQILHSVDNSVETFKVSSENLLADLGRDPNGFNDQLSFAQSLDWNYKSTAMQTLTLSNELSYAEFERDVFEQVIQKRVTIDELRDWNSKLTNIKSEINKHQNASAHKGALTGLSVKWLKSGEATTQDLGAIYAAIDNAAVPFEESTKKLLQDLSQSLLDSNETLAFARSITSEYKHLAIQIRDNSKAVEYGAWGESFFDSILQKRPSIEQLRAMDNMWASAIAFTQREKARTVNEFGSSNEQNRKSVIERASTETWSDAEFTSLEAIAELARHKNACDRHMGMSSLADCGGLSLFSKQKRKFFDSIFGNRYIGLSRDFISHMNQLAADEWTTLRRSIVNEFFGAKEPIWSMCNSSLFSQKADALKNQVSALAREKNPSLKWDLERQIKETIRNCQ